ncbi:MAG TPA: NAD(P)-binding domain-containing protein, partial [Sphingorhabdus sp.]|nr:NAD(P)-binding domain-containing protein [Sphingorhabdus sp.]
MTEISRDNPLLFFGCGNMGGAMLDGWIAGGMDPAAFIVVDPMAQSLPDGVWHFADASQVGRKVGVGLIAVKPQIFGQIASQLEAILSADALLLSVMAGVRIETLQAALPGQRVMRLMPNLAAALGKSPLGLFDPSGDA